MIRNKYRSYGKFLVGVCCFSIMNGCSDKPESSDSSSGDELATAPTLSSNDAVEFFNSLLTEMPEDRKAAILANLESQDIFKSCEEISKALSKERTQKLMQDLAEKSKKSTSAEESYVETFCQSFSSGIEESNGCCVAILLYSAEEKAYSDVKNRDRLFDDVHVYYIEKHRKEGGAFDKKTAIKQILHRLKIEESDLIKKGFSDLMSAVVSVNEKTEQGFYKTLDEMKTKLKILQSQLQQDVESSKKSTLDSIKGISADLTIMSARFVSECTQTNKTLKSIIGDNGETVSLSSLQTSINSLQEQTKKIETITSSINDTTHKTIEEMKKQTETIFSKLDTMTSALQIESQKMIDGLQATRAELASSTDQQRTTLTENFGVLSEYIAEKISDVEQNLMKVNTNVSMLKNMVKESSQRSNKDSTQRSNEVANKTKNRR